MTLRTVPNVALETIMGEPWQETTSDGTHQVVLADVVRALLGRMKDLKGQRIKFEDDEQALLVAQTLRAVTDGVLVFEETPHKWLVEYVKQDGPKLLSPNTVPVVQALEARVPEAK